jgi:hypothetical protein
MTRQPALGPLFAILVDSRESPVNVGRVEPQQGVIPGIREVIFPRELQALLLRQASLRDDGIRDETGPVTGKDFEAGADLLEAVNRLRVLQAGQKSQRVLARRTVAVAPRTATSSSGEKWACRREELDII